jgi:hypothetical protein
LPRHPEALFPPKRPWPWTAIVASVLVHSVLLFGWVTGRVPTLPHRPVQLVVLAPPAEGPRAVPMPYRSGPRADGQTGKGAAPQRTRPTRPPQAEPLALRPQVERPPEQPVDTGTAPVVERPVPLIGRIGPGLADGRLWVRPLPLPPKELAQRLSKGHAQLVDSAVTAIVQAFLDSIETDPSARSVGLPSWTKEIAGKKFGLDSGHIYVAGLKIPAAVLALLPIPAGNVDQNRAYNHMMDLRADLQYAAQRSANLAEFKEMIKEMRLRKEREREFEQNQRTAPPPEEPATP